MRNILEDIYYDRLSMNEQMYRRGSKYDKAISEVTRLEDRLLKLLPEHHQDLKDYSNACADLASISKLDDFIKGFRVGAQVMLEVLRPEESALIPIGSEDEMPE